ncbi:MAG TPA: hypothetical protein VHG08_07880 [Longimicrobium sp.]|nr:hypothetical protein [Longimicrobium sp.]
MAVGKFIRSNGVAVVIVAVTVVHLGYRVVSARGNEMITVSDLAVGQPFPALAMQPLEEGVPLPASAPCEVVVVFNPFCRHCHTAANAEKYRYSAANLPTTWVSVLSSKPAVDFRYALTPASRLVFVPEVVKTLKLSATPAAFLVGPDRRIRDVWTYSGEESHAELREKCASA